MIIQSIVADNVFQYCKLSITELPEKGTIVVSGGSQSARESITESVCFALFGHSYSQNILHEGASDCLVKVQFLVDDGQQYELVRTLNNQGLQSTKLQRLGEPDGLVEVDQNAIDHLIGFTYEMFIEYILLVNREEAPPLSCLKERRDTIGRQLKEKQELLSSLNYRMTLFQGSQRTIRKAKRGLKQSNFFQGLMVLYTLYLLLAAASIIIAPESGLAEALTAQLLAQYPGWDSTDISPIIYSIVALCLLIAFTWGLCLILKMRIKGLLQVPEKMAEALAGLDKLAAGAPEEQMAERHIVSRKLLEKSAQPEEVQGYIDQMKPWIELSLDKSKTHLLMAERAVVEAGSGFVALKDRFDMVQKWLSEVAIAQQFLFLDGYCETALITPGSVLSQIWYSVESVSEKSEAATLHIRCENGSNELRVCGSSQ